MQIPLMMMMVILLHLKKSNYNVLNVTKVIMLTFLLGNVSNVVLIVNNVGNIQILIILLKLILAIKFIHKHLNHFS